MTQTYFFPLGFSFFSSAGVDTTARSLSSVGRPTLSFPLHFSPPRFSPSTPEEGSVPFFERRVPFVFVSTHVQLFHTAGREYSAFREGAQTGFLFASQFLSAERNYFYAPQPPSFLTFAHIKNFGAGAPCPSSPTPPSEAPLLFSIFFFGVFILSRRFFASGRGHSRSPQRSPPPSPYHSF